MFRALTYHSHRETVLDLFDTKESASDIDELINEFLDQRMAAMKACGEAATDLLVYFVGHGGFGGKDFDYYLAIRRTRRENPIGSGLRMAVLAHTIKEKARSLRQVIILDSCFSGAAQSAFQGAPAQAAIQQTVAAFQIPRKGRGIPRRGTALLCSSGSTIPSVISPSGNYTMFTHALLQALSSGVPQKQEPLSLRNVVELIINILDDEPDEKAPYPQLHSPDQREGDVADVPFFPNHVARASKNVVDQRMARRQAIRREAETKTPIPAEKPLIQRQPQANREEKLAPLESSRVPFPKKSLGLITHGSRKFGRNPKILIHW